MNDATAIEEVVPLTSRQLDAYLARIGLSKPARADFEALAAIHRAHLMSFTWETLDAFIDAMRAIAREAREQPELVRNAPHETPVRRIDEARAARQPDLRWRADVVTAEAAR